ncbi:MAG TPA: CinA family protein [Methyloceanibacter sp.]|jgi:nicotinamide-nucleotide amidase|nr:CinA family protein [Methyloceanibacter sp.]
MTERLEVGEEIMALAVDLLSVCRDRGELIATAESCTGGLLAATMTAIPGCSDCFERGFVTYSNASKSEMLGVPVWLIERHGAVSEDVARAMAGGALTHSRASLAVSITGIAGPDGGTADKPVGLVHLAAGRRDEPIVHERVLFGDLGRTEVQRRSVAQALRMLRALL